MSNAAAAFARFGVAGMVCAGVILAVTFFMNRRKEQPYGESDSSGTTNSNFNRQPRTINNRNPNRNSSNFVPADACIACYQPFEEGDNLPRGELRTVLGCGHQLHKECYDAFRPNRIRECPSCGTSIY